jgi:uncharacterized protein (TIGR00255 family)
MTGHGEGLQQNDQAQVNVEVRAVNNRFLKLNVFSDLSAKRQTELETMVKSHLNRGSVSVRVRCHIEKSPQDYRLNKELISSYWLQLSEIADGSQPVNLESILQLPGVVEDSSSGDKVDELWPLIKQAATDALLQLNEMRHQEGDAMKQDMLANCQKIGTELSSVEKLAPNVVEAYGKKMTDRINGMLEKFEVSITATDIVREVGVFAERCDISEEVVRLQNHLGQFNSVVEEPQSNGKKLEFLVQEMLRETNTIGSKANDSDIARHVVEMKTAIERIREMVQNVE